MKHWVHAGLLAVLVAAAFANSFPGEFHFDDFPLMLQNPQVNGDSFRYASFLDHYGGRPLTLWTFHISYALFGSNPFGYHAFSVFLHFCAVLLLYLALRADWGGFRLLTPGWACLAAGLFAVHPLQAQPVNYIWSRSMPLMAVFALAALLLIRRHPVWALFALQMAVWSRTEALVLIPFLALAAWDRWKPLASLAAVNTAAFCFSLISHSPPQVAWNHSDPWAFWMAQPAVLAEYLRLMAWPSGLTIEHHFQPGMTRVVVALAIIAALAGAAGAIWRRSRAPALALSWAVLWLAPSMAIPNGDLLNESRAYLALGGVALLGAWAARELWRSVELDNRWAALAAAPILACLLFSTWHRNGLWLDDIALYREAVERSPDKMRAHYNLGSALARHGLPGEAEEAFRRAARLRPGDDLSYSAWGYCAEVQGRLGEAVSLYRQSLQLNPDNQRAREGIERLATGYYEDAL